MSSDSTPNSSPAGTSAPTTNKTWELDPAKMIEEDFIFMENARTSLRNNVIGGSIIAGGSVYGLLRRFNAGRASRIGLTTFSALGGALFGLSRAVSHVTKAIPELPPNSQCKILARKVLAERYPLAMAEAIDDFEKKQSKP